MTAAPFQKGLSDLGHGSWAYLQPDGSWGYSNAGLITDSGESLLVDTLFDLPLTQAMLTAMADATPAARNIDVLVNTHANGDHCYGNQLVQGARIIASQASAEEMDAVPPAMMAEMIRRADELGVAGQYFRKSFGAFEFEGITPTPPTETFERQCRVKVGDKSVELIEVGPAHTRGDILVHVPEDDVVFTGDILFIDGTPILWEGPISNWIDACDRILAMKPRVIVPGHGPLTDLNGVRGVRDYLGFIRDEARERFDAGLSASEAAQDIALGRYSSWLDSERIVINVQTLYSEFDPKTPQANLVELFGLMGEIAT
ncbi:MAG: MBL fold metallo-hydrolase [bacterium TMED88]|nr:MBL fold metallo-hydrolase [Deltaproteobacteria bacterium]OUV34437.1 MAG: MBL fold metallo-hydrolase [bacterium TMED88]